MGHPDRLPDLLRILNESGSMHVTEAARRLGIDRRSVYRLRDRALTAGYQLDGEPGSGMLELRAEQRSVGLSEDQRLQLAALIAHLPGDVQQLVLGESLRAAQWQTDPTQIPTHIHAALLRACTSPQQIRVTYSGRAEPLDGTALGTVRHRHLYVIVRVGEELRSLRCDRVTAVRALEIPAERQPECLESYLGSGWGPWGWGRTPQTLTLLASDRARTQIQGSWRHPSAHWDGNVLTLQIHPCREFIGWVLSLGGELVPLSPPELVQDVQARADRLSAALNNDTTGAGKATIPQSA